VFALTARLVAALMRVGRHVGAAMMIAWRLCGLNTSTPWTGAFRGDLLVYCYPFFLHCLTRWQRVPVLVGLVGRRSL